jgi:hypothetical protein
MDHLRSGHTATPLTDGRISIVGGGGSGVEQSTREIYDPATGTWSAAPRTGAASPRPAGRPRRCGGWPTKV